MATLHKLPKRKIEKLLPEITKYYRQAASELTPEIFAYLENSVRTMQQNIEFAELQMLHGLIAGLKRDKETVRSCYELAKSSNTFFIHSNFLAAFHALNDVEYEDQVFYGAKQTMQSHDLAQLNFMISRAVSCGYAETALALLQQQQKSDIHFQEEYMIDFYEKIIQMGLNEKKSRLLFSEINQKLIELNAYPYAKMPTYLDNDEDTLILEWVVTHNQPETLLQCQDICDDIMIDFEEKHQLNLSKLFIVVQAQEVVHV